MKTRMRPTGRASRRILAAVAAIAALMLTATPTAAAPSTRSHVYIVGFVPGQLGRVTRAIRAGGGRVVQELDTVDTVVADLTVDGAARLSAVDSVRTVVPDGALKLSSTSYDAESEISSTSNDAESQASSTRNDGESEVSSTSNDAEDEASSTGYEAEDDVNSMYSVTAVIGARDGWSRYTGQGIDVALLDSGVAPVAGLDTPGKVVSGPDLSFDSQNPNLRHIDTFGHGTHMAGIIAGRDASWAAGDSNEDGSDFAGVAPGARIVSLKLADASGATDVSQVIAGLDWVVQHAHDPGMNIRVVNLSFGTASMQPYQLDPLAHAAEVAWRHGIVVVVAAGNDGSGTGKLSDPAQDPYVIAVGAVDANGTRDTSDDVVPPYSSRGDGIRNPDLVAPGAHVPSLRVPGSYVDTHFGTGPGSINDRFIRGSGTSQAAAVVSGAVALLLEQRPWLSPDQVKALLKATARPLPSADPQASGSGLVNVKKAMQTAPSSAAQSWAPSSGNGSLDAARGGSQLVLNGVPLSGERDIFGADFDAGSHALAAEAMTAWQGGTWNGEVWSGADWAGQTWADATWTGQTWAGTSWTGQTWADGTWTGQTWVGQTWAGQTWAGQTWVGQTWVGQTWVGHDWTIDSWN